MPAFITERQKMSPRSFKRSKSVPVGVIDDSCNEMVKKVVKENINNGKSFYFVDLEDVIAKFNDWVEKLPQIRPYYAVKCNTTEIVLRTLAQLGAGFDCASKGEIEQVIGIGVRPESIIFANPCKTTEALKYAKSVGVDLMTFDNDEELYKIQKHFPEARVVLRIKTNDTDSKTPLSIKYGVDICDIEYLMRVASELQLNVVGISFHVGSNTGGTDVYRQAIRDAKYGFQVGKKYGHKMTLLDVGGGYPGNKHSNLIKTTFPEIAKTIKDEIAMNFGNESGIQIISEPGRYFVASAFTLVTQVVSRKKIRNNGVMYYLMDGIYGAFANGWCDFNTPVLTPLLREDEILNRKQQLATFWGPTCDSVDCVLKDIYYPQLNVGEWVVVKDMGAYSLVAGSKFNGFDIPSCIFVSSLKTKKQLELPLTTMTFVNNGSSVVCILE